MIYDFDIKWLKLCVLDIGTPVGIIMNSNILGFL